MELHLLRLNPELPLSRRTLRYVSASRREKVERMRHPEDRKRSLTAELMLRCAASRICGIPPRNLTIANGPYGKPYLPDVTDFHFNLSHSGQYVVLAIGHLPLGVDVERMQPMEDTMKSIAARFFTDREYRVLLSKSGDALCRTFYTLWTLKESYIKAEGRVLSIPLDSFEFELGEVIRLTKNIGEHRYSFFTHCLEGTGAPPHMLALCSQETIQDIVWNKWEEKDFIRHAGDILTTVEENSF